MFTHLCFSFKHESTFYFEFMSHYTRSNHWGKPINLNLGMLYRDR